MADAELSNDHWVSRGYQQNFASDERRVSVLDVRTGEIIDSGRAIRRNFSERGFTTFLRQGVPDDLLERAFMAVESRVLEEVRKVRCGDRPASQHADIADLFAVHLVRSPSFKTFYGHITERVRKQKVPQFATESELRSRLAVASGHPPSDDELLAFSLEVYAELIDDPMHLVETMLTMQKGIAEELNGMHLQIIEVEEGLPAFVLGDTPVLHLDARGKRYGFRDQLAVGDAHVIAAPLTRTTAACFTRQPLSDIKFTTRKRVDAWNALFIRAAGAEVACHPDDARTLRQTHMRLDRLPASILLG